MLACSGSQDLRHSQAKTAITRRSQDVGRQSAGAAKIHPQSPIDTARKETDAPVKQRRNRSLAVMPDVQEVSYHSSYSTQEGHRNEASPSPSHSRTARRHTSRGLQNGSPRSAGEVLMREVRPSSATSRAYTVTVTLFLGTTALSTCEWVSVTQQRLAFVPRCCRLNSSNTRTYKRMGEPGAAKGARCSSSSPMPPKVVPTSAGGV
jgi:hypothetical protein